MAEPKWDGVRAVVVLDRISLDASVADGWTTAITSRLANDVTGGYPELAGLARRVGRRAVLDGEIVTFDPAGRPSFNRLQRRMHVRQPAPELQAEVPVRLLVFDLLWLDGDDLTGRPWTERRAALEALVVGSGGALELSPLLPTHDGATALLAACCAVGFEGFVAKRADAPYLPGRRGACWQKAKALHRRELVVGGWEEGERSRAGRIGSLAIGWVDPAHRSAWPDGPCLRWAGQVGSGFTDAILDQLHPMTTRFAVSASPFLDAPRSPGVRWLAPVLVVEVQFAEVTATGTLRFPVLKGIRTDVVPADCGPGEGLGPDKAEDVPGG